MEVFLKVFFLLGWTKTFLLIFTFNLEIGFFASLRKEFINCHEIFEELFLFTDFVKA